MARTKCKLTVSGDMFGRFMTMRFKSNTWQIGNDLEYDPLQRMDPALSTGYLFRSPKAKSDQLCDIWPTLEQFTEPYQVWVEGEYKNDDVEFTAFARISDRSEATMFAFAHNTFEKWSDEKEAEDAAQRDVEKPDTVTVNDDGTVRITIEATELGD